VLTKLYRIVRRGIESKPDIARGLFVLAMLFTLLLLALKLHAERFF